MDGSARQERSLTATGGRIDGRWRALTASVQGPTHVRDGIPNQDAVASAVVPGATGGVTLAVSDGHGSRRCFRSHVGAQFAVEAAIDVAPAIAALHGADERSGDAVASALDGDIPSLIVERWARAVRLDLEEHPLDAHELERAGVDRVAAEADPLRAYGATLVACVITDDFATFLQIGDGDLVVVSVDGTAVRPLPEDARLIADETTSLCLPNAANTFRGAWLDLDDDPLALVLAASDGYGNSFATDPAMEWYEAVGGDLLEHLRSRGPDWVEGHLEEWLAESAEHSGDDTTVGFLYRTSDGALGAASGPVGGDVRRPDDGEIGDDGGGIPVDERQVAASDDSPPGRRRTGALAIVGASALIVGCVMGFAAGRWLFPVPTDEPADTLVYEGRTWVVEGGVVVARDVESDELVGTVSLDVDATLIGPGSGAVWVEDRGAAVVYRIDAESLACDRVTAESPADIAPCDAAGEADAWSTPEAP